MWQMIAHEVLQVISELKSYVWFLIGAIVNGRLLVWIWQQLSRDENLESRSSHQWALWSRLGWQ